MHNTPSNEDSSSNSTLDEDIFNGLDDEAFLNLTSKGISSIVKNTTKEQLPEDISDNTADTHTDNDSKEDTSSNDNVELDTSGEDNSNDDNQHTKEISSSDEENTNLSAKEDDAFDNLSENSDTNTVVSTNEVSDTNSNLGEESSSSSDVNKLSDSEEDTNKEVSKETSKEDTLYKNFYNRVMAPFKANGKEVKLDTPEEVIHLMQMGANYTRKMQEMQPYKKLLIMLQNNNLMDEGELSYLLDLKNKNPEAIKKLIKEANIDPIDIDTNEEPNYLRGDYSVSEEELNFRNTVEDITSSQAGRDVYVASQAWDEGSRQAIWKEPSILKVLTDQKDQGIYDIIVNTIEKEKLLGRLPVTVPFVSAYYQVGEQLNKAGAFNVLNKEPLSNKSNKIASKAKLPNNVVNSNTNNQRAKAASPTKVAVSRTNKNNDIFKEMSNLEDDKFLEMFNKLKNKG